MNKKLVKTPNDLILNEFYKTAANESELMRKIHLIEPLRMQRPVRILDIGAGSSGSNFVNLYSAKFPQTTVFSLDLVDYNLRRNIRHRRICADGKNLPFENESFDIVYAGNLIHHTMERILELLVENVKIEYGNRNMGLDQFTNVSPSILQNVISNKTFFNVARETYRVLKKEGVFMFTYDDEEKDPERRIRQIGFKEYGNIAEHLQDGSIQTTMLAVK